MNFRGPIVASFLAVFCCLGWTATTARAAERASTLASAIHLWRQTNEKVKTTYQARKLGSFVDTISGTTERALSAEAQGIPELPPHPTDRDREKRGDQDRTVAARRAERQAVEKELQAAGGTDYVDHRDVVVLIDASGKVAEKNPIVQRLRAAYPDPRTFEREFVLPVKRAGIPLTAVYSFGVDDEVGRAAQEYARLACGGDPTQVARGAADRTYVPTSFSFFKPHDAGDTKMRIEAHVDAMTGTTKAELAEETTRLRAAPDGNSTAIRAALAKLAQRELIRDEIERDSEGYLRTLWNKVQSYKPRPQLEIRFGSHQFDRDAAQPGHRRAVAAKVQAIAEDAGLNRALFADRLEEHVRGSLIESRRKAIFDFAWAVNGAWAIPTAEFMHPLPPLLREIAPQFASFYADDLDSREMKAMTGKFKWRAAFAVYALVMASQEMMDFATDHPHSPYATAAAGAGAVLAAIAANGARQRAMNLLLRQRAETYIVNMRSGKIPDTVSPQLLENRAVQDALHEAVPERPTLKNARNMPAYLRARRFSPAKSNAEIADLVEAAAGRLAPETRDLIERRGADAVLVPTAEALARRNRSPMRTWAARGGAVVAGAGTLLFPDPTVGSAIMDNVGGHMTDLAQSFLRKGRVGQANRVMGALPPPMTPIHGRRP